MHQKLNACTAKVIADYSSLLDGVEAESSLCTYYTFLLRLGKHTCGQSPMTTAAALAQRIVEQACTGTSLVVGKYILSSYFYY